MEFELEIELNGQLKKIKVIKGQYLNNRNVYQVTLDSSTVIIYQTENGSWTAEEGSPIEQELLKKLGTAIKAVI